MARPPSLLHLYKDYGSHVIPATETVDADCQVEIEREEDQKMWEEWSELRSQLVGLNPTPFTLSYPILFMKSKTGSVIGMSEYRKLKFCTIKVNM